MVPGAKFEVGDIVLLKSGGPRLLVSSFARADGLISVEWFDGNEIKRDCFDPQNLLLVTELE